MTAQWDDERSGERPQNRGITTEKRDDDRVWDDKKTDTMTKHRMDYDRTVGRRQSIGTITEQWDDGRA